MFKNIGKKLFVGLCSAMFSCSASFGLDFVLNHGEVCEDVKIMSKNQFGIRTFLREDPKTGKSICRYIPFSDMTPNSLRLFPYCDNKIISRVDMALRDRLALITKRFKEQIDICEKETDYMKCFNAPTGMPILRVFMKITDVFPDGIAGIAFSDAQEAQFYGMVYVYGIRAEKGTLWTDVIFADEQQHIELNGKNYPYYTIYAPNKPSILDEEDEAEEESFEQTQTSSGVKKEKTESKPVADTENGSAGTGNQQAQRSK